MIWAFPNLQNQIILHWIQHILNKQYFLANQLNVTEIVKAHKIIIDEPSFQIIKETYCD